MTKRIKGNEYTPLEEYKTAITKIKVRHNVCGSICETTSAQLFTGGGCLKCGYSAMKLKQRKTHNEFCEEVDQKGNGEYSVLTAYINNTTKILIKHIICGFDYHVAPRDFLSGKRCPNCANKNRSTLKSQTHDEFMTKLKKVLPYDYTILNFYKNAKIPLLVRHETCGREYKVMPYKLLNGNKCAPCIFKEMGRRCSKSHEQFIKEISEISSEYAILTEYEKNQKKVLVKHNKCDNEFWVTPDSMLRGSGCPRCKESRGEKIISKFLRDNNITHISQYKFNDCVYKSTLCFDFAIMDNNDVVALIEYQGRQHYQPIGIFGGADSLKTQKIKDSIKRKYAEDKCIPLIEIPYYEADVKSFLKNNVNKLIPR